MSGVQNDFHFPMVPIQGGEIVLRDDRTKKNWSVKIEPFLLGQYPVTGEQYKFLTKKTSSIDKQKPVVNLSWYEAIYLCNLLSDIAGLSKCYTSTFEGIKCDWEANGYRLPSEAEWQFACKAETAGYRYGDINKIAWYKENSGGELCKVGKKEPNTWGLYDMIGNVWEWCWDVYDEKEYGPYRTFRGGSWAEDERGCGSTCRRRSHPSFCIEDLGFRLARTLV